MIAPVPIDHSTLRIDHYFEAYVRVHLCDIHRYCHVAARQLSAVQVIVLLSNTKPLDDGPIPGIINATEIIEQSSPTSD
jgi:hypothetical protein